MFNECLIKLHSQDWGLFASFFLINPFKQINIYELSETRNSLNLLLFNYSMKWKQRNNSWLLEFHFYIVSTTNSKWL